MVAMGPQQAVLVMQREWPWGLALLTEPGCREQLPDSLSTDGVAAGRSSIAARIRHAVDGEARAEVWLGEPPSELACVYDAEFTTDSGEVALSDAGNERVVSATIGAGVHRLRVLVDDPAFPVRVVFALGRP
jgi:hypothetical protein